MPKICQNCQSEFSFRWKNPETGKIHNFGNRKLCLSCSPFMLHNTERITQLVTKENKVCPRCKERKNLGEFYKRRKGEGSSAYCKLCTTLQTVERQQEIKRRAVEYKGGKCQICGYSKCQAALEFHHVGQKDFTIANSSLVSFEKIREELDKCAILCANCHREEHEKMKVVIPTGFEPVT